MTAAKAKKAAERAADTWEDEIREEYQKQKELGNAYRLLPDKRRDDFVSLVNDTWFVLQVRGENDKLDIQKYLAYLRTEYKGKQGKPLSAKTLRNQYGTLHSI